LHFIQSDETDWSETINEHVKVLDKQHAAAVKELENVKKSTDELQQAAIQLPFPTTLVCRPITEEVIKAYNDIHSKQSDVFNCFVDDTARASKTLYPDLLISCFAENQSDEDLAEQFDGDQDKPNLQKLWKLAGGDEEKQVEWKLIMKPMNSYSKALFVFCFHSNNMKMLIVVDFCYEQRAMP
jgi:hypothetical protein